MYAVGTPSTTRGPRPPPGGARRVDSARAPALWARRLVPARRARLLDDHRPDVVAVARVLLPGVAQADHQPRLLAHEAQA